jgi:copper(I)-binding protein
MVAVGIAGALAVIPAVSACGAGEDPQSAQATQLTEGVNVTTRSGVAVRNLFVLGPPSGQRINPGSAATLYASVVNDSADGQPDRLVGISAPGVAQAVQIQGGGIDLPYQRLVQLGTSSPAGVTTPLITLQGLAMPLGGGELLNLTLQFEKAGALRVAVPVVPRDGSYTTYAPAPVTTPTAAPSPTEVAPSGTEVAPSAAESAPESPGS